MTRRHRGREQYPHVREKVGEDPARFLDRDFRDLDELSTLKARIRGIDSLEVIGAWLGVEAKLVRTPDRTDDQPAGRPKIRQLLQRRARELERNGEREQLDEDEIERRREELRQRLEADQDVEGDQPTVYRHDVDDCQSTDVERLSSMAFECHGCGKRVSAAGDRIVEVDDRREVISA